MVSITSLLTVHVVTQIALVLDIFFGNGNSKQRSEGWFNISNNNDDTSSSSPSSSSTTATIVVVTVMSVFVIVDLVALSLILQLLVLHIRLQKLGLSTYQYIVADNQKRREKNRLDEDMKYRRSVLIKNAMDSTNIDGSGGNKDWYVFRLRCGGYLREKCGVTVCDPLQLQQEEEDGVDGGENNNNHYSTNNNHNVEHRQNGGETTIQNGNGYGHEFSNGKVDDEVDDGDCNGGGEVVMSDEERHSSLRSDEA
jgi:hypothetical protein